MEEISILVFLASQESCTFPAILNNDSLTLLQKQ